MADNSSLNTGERHFGIDISRYQKDIDLSVAKEEGVRFAILKASQFDFTDPMFVNHYNTAKSRGIYVGAYHYLTATDTAGAKKEADYLISHCLSGRRFEYPIFADCEDVFLERLEKSQVDEVIRVFCGALEDAGYWAGFYCNADFYRNHCSGSELAKRFSYWHASWTKEPQTDDCQMWQFGGETNLLRVNKIGGVVCDQDYSYMDFPSKIAAKGLNGFSKGEVVPPPSFGAVSDLTGDRLRVGERVRVKKNAPIYKMSGRFQDWVYDAVFYVREIKGDRIVISTVKSGPVTGAVEARYLQKA